MLRLKKNNISSLVNRLTDMSRRVKRIDVAAPEIHEVLLEVHREKVALNPIGQNRNLGPSITDPSHPNHVFSVSGNVITFGTSVKYAGAYGARIGRNLVSFDTSLEAKLKTAVVNYVGLK